MKTLDRSVEMLGRECNSAAAVGFILTIPELQTKHDIIASGLSTNLIPINCQYVCGIHG